MRKLLISFCLFLLPGIVFAEHDGYIVAVPVNNLNAAVAMGAESKNICMPNVCYLKAATEELAIALVNSGIAESYSENTIYKLPSPPPPENNQYSGVFSGNNRGYSLFSFTPSLPNDPFFPYDISDFFNNLPSQWSLNMTGYINWPGGYNTVMPISTTAKIAVVDTGYLAHADAGDVTCYNIFNLLTDCNDIDTTGWHGTGVTGVIAAQTDNGIGIAGVGYGKVSVLNIAAASLNNALEVQQMHYLDALTYLRVFPEEITAVNISSGGYMYNEHIYEAIGVLEYENIIVVTSAGNDNYDTSTYPHYPSSYTYNNIINVVSLNNNYGGIVKSLYSNYGGYSDIAAPGTGIFTFVNNNDYDFKSGTSFAAPFITGVLGAGKALGPHLTSQQLVQLLYYSADRVESLKPYVRNGKVVNVAAFVEAVKTLEPYCAVSPNSNMCTIVSNVFPQRYDMANLPSSDPDASPNHWVKPTGFKTVSAGSNSIKLSWNKSYLADSYKLMWRKMVGGSWQTVTVGKYSPTEHTLNNLIYGQYEFQLSSVRNGKESPSVTAQYSIAPQWPQVTPLELLVGPTATIAYTVPVEYTVLKYYIENVCESDVSIYINNVLAVYVPMCSGEASGSIAVQENDAIWVDAANGTDSMSLFAHLIFTRDDGWPTNFVASGAAYGVNLSWTPPVSTPDNYSLFWHNGSDWGEVVLSGSAASYTFTNLVNGAYAFGLYSVKDGYRSDILSSFANVGNELYEMYVLDNQDVLSFTVPSGYTTATYYFEIPTAHLTVYVDGEFLLYEHTDLFEGTFTVSSGQEVVIDIFAVMGEGYCRILLE
jgi:hypothetical protein